MNNETTIERARGHIARVPTAINNADLSMMAGHARTWLDCLQTEGLIDREVFKALSIELNNATDEAVTRIDGPRR